MDRPFQQSGLGALMYQAVLEECRSSGCQIASTRISINNLDVLNLFTRLECDVRNAVVTLHRVAAARDNPASADSSSQGTEPPRSTGTSRPVSKSTNRP